jgi:hypothetical protein
MRAAVCGSAGLLQSAATLGLDVGDGPPDLVLLEIDVQGALANAAAIPAAVPRIVVADAARRDLVRALGLDGAFIASSTEPHVLGPLVRAAFPPRPRRATRLVVVTAARGGVGRTLLAANLARRLARRLTTWLVDATGSGALAWWLNVEARPWAELEAMAAEIDGDALRVVAGEPTPRLRVLGGPPVMPTRELLRAVIGALASVDELVFVDAPPLADERARDLVSIADRVLVPSYGDPASIASLATAGIDESWWLLASQSSGSIGDQETFRSLPRDEAAISRALGSRDPAGGALGRAYDDLAELIAIDAT